MDKNALAIRPMNSADLPTCLKFTQQVKWPHKIIDWQLHFKLGTGSIIENDKKDIVGCILWWDYGQEYATVGLVVVPEHMQGNGLGRSLMDLVIKQAGSRNLQLVATLAGKRLYQQCGFQEETCIYQVQGELSSRPKIPQTELVFKPLSSATIDDASKLDYNAYQCSRKPLLKALAECGEGLVAFDEDTPVGYAVIRDSGHGETIGPIVATNDAVGKILIAKLLNQVNAFVRFDLTEQSTAIKTWLEGLGLKEVDKVSLMVKGQFLPAKTDEVHLYSLASQAFG